MSFWDHSVWRPETSPRVCWTSAGNMSLAWRFQCKTSLCFPTQKVLHFVCLLWNSSQSAFWLVSWRDKHKIHLVYSTELQVVWFLHHKDDTLKVPVKKLLACHVPILFTPILFTLQSLLSLHVSISRLIFWLWQQPKRTLNKFRHRGSLYTNWVHLHIIWKQYTHAHTMCTCTLIYLRNLCICLQYMSCTFMCVYIYIYKLHSCTWHTDSCRWMYISMQTRKTALLFYLQAVKWIITYMHAIHAYVYSCFVRRRHMIQMYIIPNVENAVWDASHTHSTEVRHGRCHWPLEGRRLRRS